MKGKEMKPEIRSEKKRFFKALLGRNPGYKKGMEATKESGNRT
jgi:hypothetical protein